MDSVNLGLAIAGLILGLISAWPKLVSWASSAKNFQSKRAQKIAATSVLQFKLAAADPSYLVAFGCRNLALGFGMLWLASGLGSISSENTLLVWAALIVRLVFSLFAGSLLGSLIGLSMVVMRRKEQSARADG